ncbi:MAG: conditioned medium-induced protein 4 [Halodesulfurarchaeum sp.]
MADRTDELRELFESVTGTETVTEPQADTHGTLATDRDGLAALEAEIDRMRERLDFETPLSTSQLARVVQRFYAGAGDAEIAADLETAPEAVRRARLDLHLVRDGERPPDSATDQLRAVEAGAKTVAAVAEQLDRSAETVRRWLAVRATQTERRRVADRYRQSFESLLADQGEIAERLTASLEETGMGEVLADQEVDVDM